MGAQRREDPDQIVVVRFADPILDAVSIEAIRTKLFQLVDAHDYRAVILDFHDVSFVSSAALGVLIALQKRTEAGALVLCDLSPEILAVLQATKLDQLFRICPDGADVALTYFSTGRESRPIDDEPVVLRLGSMEEE